MSETKDTCPNCGSHDIDAEAGYEQIDGFDGELIENPNSPAVMRLWCNDCDYSIPNEPGERILRPDEMNTGERQ